MAQEYHSFKIELATMNVDDGKQVGVENAIFLQDIAYWCDYNKSSGTNFNEGRYWMFSTVDELCERHPYWTQKQLRRIIKNCEECGLLISGNFNQNQYDRTKWYSVSDNVLDVLGMGKSNITNGQIHLTKRANGSDQTGKSNNIYIYNNTCTQKYSNENTSTLTLLKEVLAMDGFRVPDNARKAQEAVFNHLSKNGFNCQMEYPVDDRGDGRCGRIDIVAEKDGIFVAIEIDRESPREKSVYKLMQMDCEKVIMLRCGGDERPYTMEDGITVIGLKCTDEAQSRSTKRFVPPTVDEVQDYCAQRKNGIDPEAFVSFYASKGWVVGKSPMKDWKAAVQTWERKRAGERKEEKRDELPML